MLSKFFIERPIFAGVLAIMVMALGIFSVLNLPVERYPDIAPPRITVSATYTGASAETVEESVTQVLEQQIKGLDHLLYFSSSSDSSDEVESALALKMVPTPIPHKSRYKMRLMVQLTAYLKMCSVRG